MLDGCVVVRADSSPSREHRPFVGSSANDGSRWWAAHRARDRPSSCTRPHHRAGPPYKVTEARNRDHPSAARRCPAAQSRLEGAPAPRNARSPQRLSIATTVLASADHDLQIGRRPNANDGEASGSPDMRNEPRRPRQARSATSRNPPVPSVQVSLWPLRRSFG